MKITIKLLVFVLLECLLFSMVSCIPGSGDEPWGEEFLSVIDSDGKNLMHLVEDVYGNPKFSFDGEKIILANNEGFWLIKSVGSENSFFLSEIVPDSNQYEVSNYRNELIFSDGNNLYKLDFEDLEIYSLTNYTNGFVSKPNYSPDESKIVYSWSTYNIENGTIHNELIVINWDGSGMNKILIDSTGFDRIYNPTFIPINNKIGFSKTFQGIFICNIDGASLQHIFNGIVTSEPIKSDGETLVFTANSHEIITYNLTNETFNYIAEGYNPDYNLLLSKLIYYKNGLFIVDIDGGNLEKLANSSTGYQSFSENGDKIVFIGQINHKSTTDRNPLH